jgi:hypothetical protein
MTVRQLHVDIRRLGEARIFWPMNNILWQGVGFKRLCFTDLTTPARGPECAPTRMGRAPSPSLAWIEGSPGQIHGVATSQISHVRLVRWYYGLLRTLIRFHPPFKKVELLKVWLAPSVIISLPSSGEVICQHQNTNQRAFSRIFHPLIQSSQIVSGRIISCDN